MVKSLCVAAAAIFAGIVGYKIIKKTNPELIKKVKGSFSNAGQKVCSVLDEAKESFQEGYAHG